jgi:membrane-associated phospholipid phosphatase
MPARRGPCARRARGSLVRMLRRSAAALVTALGCVLATTVVWLLAFQSGAGARLDSSVLGGFTGLRGSRVGPVADAASHLADPMPFAVFSLLIVSIALVRRLPRHALVAALVLAGATVTTQLLKPVATIPRPAELPPFAPVHDGWPSGHTTAAMALALCLVLVVPARYRPLAAAAGGMFAVAEAYGLLVMSWHYPSDVVGAFGVAAAWLALGVAALRATSGRAETSSLRARTVFAPAAVAALAGVALVAGVVLLRPARALEYAQEHTAFVAAAVVLGAAGLALAAVAAAALPLVERAGSGNDEPVSVRLS